MRDSRGQEREGAEHRGARREAHRRQSALTLALSALVGEQPVRPHGRQERRTAVDNEHRYIPPSHSLCQCLSTTCHLPPALALCRYRYT